MGEPGLHALESLLTSSTCALRRHKLGIYACDFSNDGHELISCSHDNSLVRWDVHEGAVLRRYAGHVNQVFQCQFNPTSTKVSCIASYK